MKKTIKYPILVEGQSDKNKILSCFNALVFITNGYSVDSSLVNLLNISQKEIIVLTDADEAGQTIRNNLKEQLKKTIDVELPLNKCNKRGKHGVAECDINVFKEALDKYSVEKDGENKFLRSDFLMLPKDSITEFINKYKLTKDSKKYLIDIFNLLDLNKEDIENGNY